MRVHKNRPAKVIIVIIAISLVAALGTGAYFLLSPNDDQGAQFESDSQTLSRKDSSDTMDQDSKSDINTSGHEPEKNIQAQYEGDNPNNASSLYGVVSHKSVADGQLSLRTTISQTIGSGACQLQLTNGQQVVTRSSGIIQNPSSATCEGFDIPTSGLSSGTWNIEITITSGDRSGTIKDSVTI